MKRYECMRSFQKNVYKTIKRQDKTRISLIDCAQYNTKLSANMNLLKNHHNKKLRAIGQLAMNMSYS